MENLNCPKCHTEINFGTKFCQNCGYNFEYFFNEKPICPRCHKTFPPGSKFCDLDGTKLISSNNLKNRCINCGTIYSIDTKFCPADGGTMELNEIEHQTYNIHPIHYSTNNGHYPKASLVSRFIASVFDSLISLFLSLPSIIFSLVGYSKLIHYKNDEAISLFIFAAIVLLIPLTYSLIKDGFGNGQSWGKKAVGLMVIYLPINKPCSLGQSFLRNLIMGLVCLIPFIGLLVEPTIVLVSDEGRRFGDKVANTQVIDLKYFNN